MKRILLLALLLALPVTITHGDEFDFKESFTVTPGGTFNLLSDYGEVEIRVWEKNEVLVIGEGISDKNQAGFTADQRGNSIYIVFKNNKRWGDGIKFIVTIPSKFNLNINTAAGDISLLNNSTGNHILFTAGGDITTRNITGDLDASTSGGEIRMGSVTGKVKAKTAGGDVIAADIAGDTHLLTSGGNIVAGTLGGNAKLGTAGGDIQVNTVAGEASLKTSGGNVSASLLKGNSELATAGGSINVRSAVGKLVAKTSGGEVVIKNLGSDAEIKTAAGDISITFSAGNTGKVRISNSAGDVIVNLPSAIKATLKGNVSSFGWGDEVTDEVQSDFPVTTKKSGGKVLVNCSINGGNGATISVDLTMGSLRIRKI